MLCASLCVCVFIILLALKCSLMLKQQSSEGQMDRHTILNGSLLCCLERAVVSNCSASVLLLSDHFCQLRLLVIRSSSEFYGERPGL